jgi:hypothetical protein
VDVSWTSDGRGGGRRGSPREYHRLWRDYLLLSIRAGGLTPAIVEPLPYREGCFQARGLRPVLHSYAGSGEGFGAAEIVVHPDDATITEHVHHIDLAVEWRPWHL